MAVDARPRSRHSALPAFPTPRPPTIRGFRPAPPVTDSEVDVTDSEVERPPANTWEAILANLRRRYPGQKDSVLFCIYRLQQNPSLTIRELKPEADLHQIPMAGRALHSAKVLLGLIKTEAPAMPVAPVETATESARRRRERRASAGDALGGSIEETVLAAVRQIQSTASEETEQLRAAVRQAIVILQRALGD